MQLGEEKARQRLEEIEEFYRSAPVGHCLLDRELRYVRINQWLARAHGLLADDHIGLCIREVIPAIAEVVERACRRVLETGEPVFDIEIEPVIAPGEGRRHWLASYFPWRDGHGEVRGIHVVVVDLTTHKNALAESEERFRAIFDNAAAGIALIDDQGRFHRVNPSLCETFGYSEEELLRLTVDKVTHPDDIHVTQQAFQSILSGETDVARFQKRYISKEGSVVWTKTMVTALRDPARRAPHLVAVIADITELQQALEALRASEAVRNSIMENSPDCIAMLDRDGICQYFNRAVPGEEQERMLGRLIFDVVDSNLGEALRASLDRVLASGNPDRFEATITAGDGSDQWVETHVGPVLRFGEVTGHVASTRNVTERKRAEQALKNSEDRYRSVIELSPDAIFLNKYGRIVYMNSAGLRLFGASSADQIVGQSVLDLFHPDFHDLVRRRVAHLLEHGGQNTLIEKRIIRLDGTVLDVDAVGSMFVDHGTPTIQVVLRDITKRKRAEDALARSELHFRSLIENSLDVFSILNRDGTTRYQSPSTKRVLGYDPEELEGTDTFELIHPADIEMARKRFAEGLGIAGTHLPLTLRMRHRNGSWRTVELVDNNQLDNPVVLGVVVTARDVTEREKALAERQQLEAQLWQAQKLESLGVFAGGMAHEFNNLLTSIVGFAHLAAEDISEETPAWASLQEVMAVCDRASGLIRQMLTFGRREPHQKRPLDIAAEIREAIRLLRASIPKAIEIRHEINPGCGKVMANSGQIQQIVMNLCTNAYQAMSPGPGAIGLKLTPVEVRKRKPTTLPALLPGSYVRLTVSDTGPGIDPAVRDRIFEPFFTTKQEHEGSGLGLSTVHGIVVSHDGAIGVESVPGQGSSFSVYLPRIFEETVEAASITTQPSPPSEHVMFVDDEESVLRLARQILERLGYQVTALNSAVASLEAFRSRPASFDIVISDLNMPDINGLDLATEIKKLRPDVPIILTTGYARTISPERAREHGIREILLKPFTVAQLRQVLTDTLADPSSSSYGDSSHESAG